MFIHEPTERGLTVVSDERQHVYSGIVIIPPFGSKEVVHILLSVGGDDVVEGTDVGDEGLEAVAEGVLPLEMDEGFLYGHGLGLYITVGVMLIT